MAFRSFLRLTSLSLLTLAAPALAQNEQSPLVPGLERFELNGERPRPAPAARPTPAPRATPSPRATPTARPTPTARAAEPAVRPEPSDVVTATTPPAAPLIAGAPVGNPPPVGAPEPDAGAGSSALIDIGPDQPSARPTTAPVVNDTAIADDTGGGIGLWPILLGLLLLGAGAVAAYVFWRRRRELPEENLEIEMTDLGGGGTAAADPVADLRGIAPRGEPAPIPAVAPARPADLPDMPSADAFPPAPPQADAPAPSPTPFFIRDTAPTHGPRAWLELGVRPQRGGTNLTGAAVDYEIDIVNNGDADATGIRLDLRLLSASADQDAILAALYAAPIDKPIVAPFEVAAGEQVSLGGMALLPQAALSIMTVQNREFFVPLLSLNLVYGWGTAARGQTASAHVIGIERPDDVKMAPFRLDTGPRMYDHVGARTHTLTIFR